MQHELQTKTEANINGILPAAVDRYGGSSDQYIEYPYDDDVAIVGRVAFAHSPAGALAR
jgi:hypothetical protein